ncbi:hypothetical protein DFR42_12713 [Undibacterium pigrum]|uniref:Uncharacterized protein n=1 Tax=Undibacterium pigrum TaxID=401470 RepID=A0A318INF9_9BURK|nr:hypothetical protein DFR42_12713 [Undibacterium pigrum]
MFKLIGIFELLELRKTAPAALQLPHVEKFGTEVLSSSLTPCWDTLHNSYLYSVWPVYTARALPHKFNYIHFRIAIQVIFVLFLDFFMR